MEMKLHLYIILITLLLNILDNAKGVHKVTHSDCWRNTYNGEVRYCFNITEIDRDGPITVKPGRHNTNSSSVSAVYRKCEYKWYDSRPDKCWVEARVSTTLFMDWMICVDPDLQNGIDPGKCYHTSASTYCIFSQPSTNLLLHTTIPVTVYVSGIVLNVLIVCVLNSKADKSVMNLLLKILAVWDLLYLGGMLVESAIGHYTFEFQIKDNSYAWDYIKCESVYSSDCITKYWSNSDTNIGIWTMDYPTLYWIHLIALVFQIASVYQTVVVATFRCIAIRRPFQASQLLTHRRAAIASACCLLLGVILHVPSVMTAVSLPGAIACRLKYSERDYTGLDEYRQCRSNVTYNPLFALSYTAFSNFHHIYHIILYTIILFLALPFALLLILNTLLLKELYTESDTPHDQENKAVTKVVITIVSIFLLTYAVRPAYIVDIYYFGGIVMRSIAFNSCAGYFTVSIIVIILPTLNSVVNLLVYMGLRKTFRQQFLDMFRCCKRHVYLQ